MNGIYKNYQIDLSSNNNFVQYNTVQGDGNDIRQIEIELIENNKPYMLGDDVEVFIAGTKPDTKQIFNSCEITEEGNILVDVTSQMSAVAGRGYYQIILISKTTNQQLKSFPLIIYVKEAAFDAGSITSSNEFNALNGMVNKIESTLNKTDLVDSMLESSSKILDDTTTAYDNAVKSLEKAQDAIDTAESINSTAEESANKAKQSEENSLSYSNIAKSYAVGTDNGIRENDSTDNAKYYKEQSELNSASALQSANLAAQKADDASSSETNAQQYATNASESEKKAQQYSNNALVSEMKTKTSEQNAKLSEENALKSESNSSKSAENAEKSATNASTFELSAKNYAENAEKSAQKASDIVGITIATEEKAGIVKPDGTTITVDEDGTLRSTDTVEVDGTTIVKTDENIIKLADALKKLIDNSVQQVKGKGLSANDFTDILLEKLNSIEEGAQINPTPVNHLLATVPGLPLDSVQGNILSQRIENVDNHYDEAVGGLQEKDSSLQEQIDTINGDLTKIVYVDIPADNQTGIGYAELERKGITKDNFINALVIDVNQVTAMQYTYSGFIYLVFKTTNTIETKAITGTVRIWHLTDNS